MATWTKVRPFRILDLDIENRPLNYVAEDFTFGEITAIGWKFVGEKGEPNALCLGEVPFRTMLLGFLAAWVQADLVSGHNLIRHDLPYINGALLEQGLNSMHPKMVCDTYLHLKRRKGIGASQSNLAAMLGVKAPKHGMSQAEWRDANRLTPEGIAKTRRRVVGDVKQHIEVRKELLARDWLRAPRLWVP